MLNKRFKIWIEAEQWVEGEWDKYNDNTDVVVEFNDSSRWVASFFTYNNISRHVEKNRATGECLNGKYFWASDMLLVDEISRERIEELVEHFIREGDFEAIFSKCSE